MKQRFITLCLFLIAQFAIGQGYILNETFSDNRNGWSLSSDANRAFEIYDGAFHFDANKSWVNTISMPVDEERDFEIETEIYKKGGVTNYGFGLAYGRKDNDNMFEFNISASGSYRVVEFADGESTNLIKWTSSSYVRKGNQSTNVLKIVKEGRYMKFYINGNYVNQITHRPFYGNYVGYSVWNDQEIKADYLRAKYRSGGNGGNMILNEQFNNNSNGWMTGEGDGRNYNIRYGKYTLDIDVSKYTSIKVKMDKYKDFEIETKITRVSGVKDRAIGLIWGRRDNDNYYEFSIAGNGYYRVSQVRNGNFEDIIAWTSSSTVKQGFYTNNVLKVKKEGSRHKFYINGTYVNQINDKSLFGTYTGFIGYMSQKIEIDYLTIKGKGSSNTTVKKDPIKNTTASTIYYDGFRDNTKGWTTKNTSDVSYSIRNGYYEFEHLREDGSWWSSNRVNVDESRDFMIETSIQRISGSEGYGYGLVWGRLNGSNQYEFALSSNGYYRIAKSEDGDWEAINAWTTSKAVKKNTYTSNKITLKKIGNTMHFYVNDTYLTSEPYAKFFGSYIGFFIYRHQKIKVDYLKVAYLDESITPKMARPTITWKTPSSYTLRTKSPYHMLNVCIASKERPSEIALYIDGKRQSNRDFNIVPSSTSCDFTWKTPVEFKEGGKYALKLEVTNSGGTSTSTRYIEYEADVMRNDNITNNTTKKQKRLALIIGNANYTHGGNLANPTNDARSMERTLRNLGFTVIKYENCTQSQVKRAMDEFGDKLKGHDVGLFFYAGHGVQVDGANYLIPTDAKLNSAKDVEYDCVRAGRILAKMESAGTRTNIVILDACRDNPFERSWSRNTKGKGLAFMNAPIGSLIAYATSPGNVASDGDGSNGLYTSALLKYINSPNLTIEQLFKKVRTTVIEKSNGKQVPWESTSLRGNFFFKQ